MDCIFCKIANKEIPSEIVYQDDLITAFKDTSPQAPVHILFVPNKHIARVDDITKEDKDLIGHIYYTIATMSKDLGLERGYRVVVNNGDEGGQTVDHLHFHLLAGRNLQWPPG